MIRGQWKDGGGIEGQRDKGCKTLRMEQKQWKGRIWKVGVKDGKRCRVRVKQRQLRGHNSDRTRWEKKETWI